MPFASTPHSYLRVVSACALGSVTCPSWAADTLPSTSLNYAVSAEQARVCPDEASFRTLVTSRMGRDPFGQAEKNGTRVDVNLRPGKSRGTLEAWVHISKPSERPTERRFVERVERCDDLLEAVATAVGIVIDPLAEPKAKTLPILPSESGKSLEPPRAEFPPDHIRKPIAPPPMPWKCAAHAAMGASMGLAPGVLFGGELGVGLERGMLALRIEGRGETQPTSAYKDSIVLDATLLSGAIAPCIRSWFLACGVLRMGVLQGHSSSVQHPSLGSSLVGSVAIRGALAVPLGPIVRLIPRAELVVPLVRTTLLVDSNPVWTAPAIGGHFGLEIGVQMP